LVVAWTKEIKRYNECNEGVKPQYGN